MVPHRIKLLEVVRQEEFELIKCVSEVAKGDVSDESVAFLNSLCTPLSVPGNLKHCLFATNDRADMYNLEQLFHEEGVEKAYVAKDEGRCDKRKGSVQKVIRLKVGAPVMLMKNMARDLVNGLVGEVNTLKKDCVQVYFPSLEKTVDITPQAFENFDHNVGRQVGNRVQVPLRLAYGSTIHKAQGLQFNHLEVDCRDVFAPGQLGVALGRAKSVKGLCVKNFSPSHHIIKANPVVAIYMSEEFPYELEPSAQCCKRQPTDTKPLASQPVIETDEDVEDEDLVAILAQLHPEETYEEPVASDSPSSSSHSSFDWDSFNPGPSRPSVQNPNPDEAIPGPTSRLPNKSVGMPNIQVPPETRVPTVTISVNELPAEMPYAGKVDKQAFLDRILFALDTIWESIPSKQRALGVAFLKGWHLFKTNTFNEVVTAAVGPQADFNAASDAAEFIRHSYFKMKTVEVVGGAQETEVIRDNHGVIRYLARRSIVKAKQECVKTVKQNMMSKRFKYRAENAKQKLDILDKLTTNVENAKTGDYGYSVEETERRQNLARRLSHVTEDVFLFYLALEKERQKLHTLDRTWKLKTKILFDTTENLKSNQDLQNVFDKVVEADVLDSKIVQDLFDQLLENFIRVAKEEFRKRLRSVLQRKKKAAHRQQIFRSKRAKVVEETEEVEAENVEVVTNTRGRGRGRATVTKKAEEVTSVSVNSKGKGRGRGRGRGKKSK